MRIRKKPWARPELDSCPFFLQNPTENRGKWNSFFKNNAPIYLELGCGKGNFIAQISSKNLDKNFIAIDLKDDMLGYARRKIMQNYKELEPSNVELLAYDIERIDEVFSRGR